MNCLVLGGAGFIGSNLAKRLKLENHRVWVIDNFITGKRKNLEDVELDGLFEIDISEASNIEEIKNVLIKCNVDTVFHLAALPSVQFSLDFPSKAHQNTLTTTVNLIESVKNSKVKRIIFSSTSAVYGNTTEFPTKETSTLNPISFYALQKLMSEQYLKLFSSFSDVKIVCLRYFNVFGTNMSFEGAYKSVISLFLDQFLKNKPLTIYNDGEQKRDFIFVEDVVRANILSSSASLEENFLILNVGSGTNVTVNEISDVFCSDKQYIGNRFEPSFSLCDNSKIKTILNWAPTISVKDWIKQMLQTSQFNIK